MEKCILKRRDFARWQTIQGLPDSALCKAVREIENGLFDADLGGLLYKKRIALSFGGKRGGYRTLLSLKVGVRYVFLHGFAKSAVANISQAEARALKQAGKIFLGLSGPDLKQAIAAGVLLEVRCDE